MSFSKSDAPGGALARTDSVAGSIAPPYASLSPSDAHDPAHLDVELASFDGSGRASPSSMAEADGPPPAYTAGTTFVHTLQLQIQTPGKDWVSLPTPLRPDPIPIYAVNAATGDVETDDPAYRSIRHSRSSGNCFLAAGSDPAQRPLSTTTYRWGPNRPAKVCLYDPLATGERAFGRSSASPHAEGSDAGAASALDEDEGASWDVFQLVPKGLLTRAVTLKTKLGHFEWRYASRDERKAAGVSSLLVLDRVTRVFTSSGKEEEVHSPLAQLVRNDELRTPGSGPSTAGNGGRLLLDTRQWEEGAKTERTMFEVLVVTTAVSMLKKEVDRRRAHQIAIMSGGGGGP